MNTRGPAQSVLPYILHYYTVPDADIEPLHSGAVERIQED